MSLQARNARAYTTVAGLSAPRSGLGAKVRFRAFGWLAVLFTWAAGRDLRIAYQTVFGSMDGQRVLADLQGFTLYQHELLGSTPEETAYNIGKHRVVQRIHGMLTLSIRDYKAFSDKMADEFSQEGEYEDVG